MSDYKNDDLVRRLRDRATTLDGLFSHIDAEHMRTAAGEIERLTKQLAVSDEQASKVEALLDPHVAWDGEPPKAQAALRDEIERLEAKVKELEKRVDFWIRRNVP